MFFEKIRWVSDVEVLINNFAPVEHQSVEHLEDMFVPSETFSTGKVRNCKSFRFFRRTKSFVLPPYPLHFNNLGINRHFFIRKMVLDCQTMNSFPCNRNLTVEISQKMNNGLIRFDIQTRFSSRQLSNFLPSWSQSFSFVKDSSISVSSFLFLLGWYGIPKILRLLYMFDASLY